MRKAVTAAIISIGILAGISESASAQGALEFFGLWWDAANQVWRNSATIGQPTVPAGGPASGYWCVVGPASLPYSLRQMAAPLPVGSLCYNGQTGSMPGSVQ